MHELTAYLADAAADVLLTDPRSGALGLHHQDASVVLVVPQQRQELRTNLDALRRYLDEQDRNQQQNQAAPAAGRAR